MVASTSDEPIRPSNTGGGTDHTSPVEGDFGLEELDEDELGEDQEDSEFDDNLAFVEIPGPSRTGASQPRAGPSRQTHRRTAIQLDDDDDTRVEDVDETEEEGRHEERFCRMRESAAEGSAVHYKACGDHCCEGDEEDEVVDEDYFADCFEACELVWLSVQEGGDSACGHCAGEPCEGEALSMSVCG